MYVLTNAQADLLAHLTNGRTEEIEVEDTSVHEELEALGLLHAYTDCDDEYVWRFWQATERSREALRIHRIYLAMLAR